MKPKKCKYCGKEIPDSPIDKRGRKNVKSAEFCRDTNHYRLHWNQTHKDLKKEQGRTRYLLRKEQNLEKATRSQ